MSGMKPLVEKTSIVLMGGWNRALMTPQWFADRIFKEEADAVALSIDFGIHPAFDFDGIRFSVNASSTRVLFKVKSKEANAGVMQDAALKLLREVPITPMSAIGVNVGFEVDGRADLSELLVSMHLPAALEKNAVRLKSTSLVRTLAVDDVTVNVVLILADGRLTIEANNHIPVATAAEAADALVKNPLAVCRRRSLSLLDQLYKLKEE